VGTSFSILEDWIQWIVEENNDFLKCDELIDFMTSRKRKQKAISIVVRCFVSFELYDKASIISDAACFLVACFCSSVSSHDEVARWFRCLSDEWWRFLVS
jgi:hypothetical protein